MKPDTYREHLNDLQVEVEELRAKLKEAQIGDLISRQAAIDALMEAFCDTMIESICKDTIEALPSAQPEIIRCKDCKFYPNHGHKDVVYDADACHWNADEMPDPDDYCSAGERRTDEAD